MPASQKANSNWLSALNMAHFSSRLFNKYVLLCGCCHHGQGTFCGCAWTWGFRGKLARWWSTMTAVTLNADFFLIRDVRHSISRKLADIVKTESTIYLYSLTHVKSTFNNILYIPAVRNIERAFGYPSIMMWKWIFWSIDIGNIISPASMNRWIKHKCVSAKKSGIHLFPVARRMGISSIFDSGILRTPVCLRDIMPELGNAQGMARKRGNIKIPWSTSQWTWNTAHFHLALEHLTMLHNC